MVPYVVKMAVDQKMKMQSSVLVGNMEYYYAAGLLKSKTGDEGLQETLPPDEMEQAVRKALEDFSPADPEENYLVTMLERYEYEADPVVDKKVEDRQQMFRVGTGEEAP